MLASGSFDLVAGACPAGSDCAAITVAKLSASVSANTLRHTIAFMEVLLCGIEILRPPCQRKGGEKTWGASIYHIPNPLANRIYTALRGFAELQWRAGGAWPAA